jgi:hypothetical protein
MALLDSSVVRSFKYSLAVEHLFDLPVVDHHVSARISKYYYGVEYLREYDPKNPSHVARKHRICDLPSGPRLLQDAFDCILARVSRRLRPFI